MFTIINSNKTYKDRGIMKYQMVKSFSFGEMGWAVKFTKKYSEAKTWKTYQGAYNAVTNLGSSYVIVRI